jgi:hypothetical protein
MAYTKTSTEVGFPPITSSVAQGDYVKTPAIGTIAKFTDPTFGTGEFIWLNGVANTVVGSLIVYDQFAGTTTLSVVGSRGPVAVAMSANVASQQGWYQISGAAVVKSGTVAANGSVYATATAGVVDDAVVAGAKIDGAVFKTADGTPSSGFAIVQLDRPSMNGNG